MGGICDTHGSTQTNKKEVDFEKDVNVAKQQPVYNLTIDQDNRSDNNFAEVQRNDPAVTSVNNNGNKEITFNNNADVDEVIIVDDANNNDNNNNLDQSLDLVEHTHVNHDLHTKKKAIPFKVEHLLKKKDLLK